VGVSLVNHNQPLTNFQHFHILGLTNKQNIFLERYVDCNYMGEFGTIKVGLFSIMGRWIWRKFGT